MNTIGASFDPFSSPRALSEPSCPMTSDSSLPSRTSTSCVWSAASFRLSNFTGCLKPEVPAGLRPIALNWLST